MSITAGSRFKGKVALVTGGNAGTDLSTALSFAMEGAQVVIAARRQSEGEAAVARIRAAGGEASFVQTDVTNARSVSNLVDACVECYGGLDVAFNITGSTTSRIEDADEATFDQVMAVNVKGVWLSMKYEIPAMLKRGGGSIINCGSGAAIRGGSGRAGAYYASKHAVMGMTRNIAVECATRNIRVNAVLPGMVMTELVARGFADDQEKLRLLCSRIPMARTGEPAEVAAAVLWLASPDSAYVTGTGLSVDGGFTI
jgi:NAD(P)-dependent dehydrogenase (short-subunit alcohol dehydrogenase family)